MKTGSYLLDTNIVSAYLEQDAHVIHQLQNAELVFLNVTVWGELLYGAFRSTRVKQNTENVYRILAMLPMLPQDKETAQYYAEIRYELKIKGRLISENDIWIAATARQFNLTLATRDRHFEFVEGLSLAEW